MTGVRTHDAVPAQANRVSPVEVFFDIVFVFTLTQLTRVLEEDLTLAGIGRVLLLFGILWWMFIGYAWLSNQIPLEQPSQRLFLFLGMAGFLTAAIGVPHAFTSTGVAFGVGYLIVVCVHLRLLTHADVGAGLRMLAPYNLGSAVLVLAGGFTDGAARYVLWIAAFALQAIIPLLAPRLSWAGVLSSFNINADHFVERTGLLVIIALGESVVAIGMGVEIDHFSAATMAVILLALALPASLWWTYFTDTRATETALAAAEPDPPIQRALELSFALTPLMIGIVIAAVGIHAAVAHPGDPASWRSALALAGGVAVYLVGIAQARHSLRSAAPRSRLIAAVAAVATIPIGTAANASAQLAAVVAAVVAMLLIADRRPTVEPAPQE